MFFVLLLFIKSPSTDPNVLSGLVQTPYFSCAEPNWISSTLERHWRDIWSRRASDSDGVPCVEPELSSTKVWQTLSNLTLLPHQTKTAIPNWFRRCSFAVVNSSVRFGTWVERRLNRARSAVLTVPNGEIFLGRIFLKLEIAVVTSKIACDPICDQLSYRRLPYP